MISEKFEVVFVHVPRSAGTAVIEYIRKFDDQVQHGHTKAFKYRYLIKVNGFYSFSIIRDPLDRAFSAYDFTLTEKSFWHDRSDDTRHPDYDAINGFSFDGIIERLYRGELSLKGHHWLPQTQFVYDLNGDIAIHRLFDFANLNPCWQFISELVGETGTQTRVNVSTERELKCASKTAQYLQEIYAKDYLIYDRVGHSSGCLLS
jgi:hypothetical protein